MRKTLQIISAILFFLTLNSCGKNSSDDYKYEVTGTSGNYSVTIENTDNETQQWSSVSNGWYYTWKQNGTRWLYLSAQNNTASGNVTVTIYKNGKVLTSNTGYGGYSIATVDGDY